ncbi:MAG: hypothetical protein LBT69_04920 [Lactobacillales bacterium]|jgi:hypothetical protein|nr:hypothetical protein [Lactobacillales bacterium]
MTFKKTSVSLKYLKTALPSLNNTRNTVSDALTSAKSTITEILRSNYTINVVGRDKNGFFTKKITTLRPTSQSIKWHSKNH